MVLPYLPGEYIHITGKIDEKTPTSPMVVTFVNGSQPTHADARYQNEAFPELDQYHPRLLLQGYYSIITMWAPAQIYIFTLYPEPKFTQDQIYLGPKFTHHQIYPQPKFTQKIYTTPDLHRPKFTQKPNLHRPQTYKNPIYTKATSTHERAH